MDAICNRKRYIAWIDEQSKFIDDAIAELTHPNAAFLADYWLPKIQREALNHAYELSLLHVEDLLGNEPATRGSAVSGEAGINYLKKFQKKLAELRQSIVTPTETAQRHKPGPCPNCGAKLYVTSTQKVRHLKCRKCGYTGKK